MRPRDILLKKKTLNAQDKKDLALMIKVAGQDPDYKLVRKDNLDIFPDNNFKRVRCRIVKKALKSIFPDYKISVRQGTGTSHAWIHVYVVLSYKPKLVPDASMFGDQTQLVRSRVSKLLDHLPVAYSSYLTDFGGGKDCYVSCVAVHCQAFELKKVAD